METIGPFEVIGRLDGGTSHRLDRALDTRFGRHVVLKRALDSAGDERLRRRAARQARAPSPRVLAVHDLLEGVDGRLVSVLEWWPFESLAPPRGLGLAREPAEAVEIVRQLLRVLEHLHECGLPHGRLDPGHILLGSLEGRPFLRLTALGSDPVDPSADLRAAQDLLVQLVAESSALPPALEEVRCRAADPRGFSSVREFREALRPGEIASWTRVVPAPELESPAPPDRTLDALLAGARGLLEEGAPDMATELVLEALRQHPDDAEALAVLERAKSSMAAGPFEAREETLARIRTDVEAFVARAQESWAEGKLEDAEASLVRAAELDPRSDHVRGLLETVRAAMAKNEAEETSELRVELEALLDAGEAEEAARLLARLSLENAAPEDLGLWQLRLCGLWSARANDLLQEGRLEESRCALGEAQRLAPGSNEVQQVSERLEDARDRARAERQRRARREALAEISHLLDSDRLREAWDRHQTARTRLGPWSDLEAAGTELAELLVAEAQWNAARDRIDAAADLLRRATVVDPRNPHARSLLAATEAALLEERQRRRTGHLLQQAVESIGEMIARGDLHESRAALDFAHGRFGDHDELRALEERLARARA